jgi:PEP-CTERM motif
MQEIKLNGYRLIQQALAASALVSAVGSVQAMPILDVSGVSTSDVMFTILPSLPGQPGVNQNADQAFGYNGNDDAGDINMIPWSPGFGSGTYQLLDKTDSGASPFNGVTWTVTAPDITSPGTWNLDWATTGVPGLPQTLDFVFVTKASTAWGAYLFDDILFTSDPLTGSGTFVISWVNNGGNVPDLSHASIYGRQGTVTVPPDPDPDPVPTPVPGTLLLLGISLLGMARARRRS